MSSGDFQFEIPRKIESYLATLSRMYAGEQNKRLREIIVNGELTVHEAWTSDNWNGGTYGHALFFALPEDLYLDILKKKNDLATKICGDVNSLCNFQDEHIATVILEMQTSEDEQWREKSGVLRPRLSSTPIQKDWLDRIWGPGQVRVFLSHRAEYKKQTSQLKESLERCGIASFVAHEDIEPTEEWQREIENALHTMDALVALLTEDFSQGNWTDQEVGVALGRGVPVIGVCLGKDPHGFMGKKQGLRGCDWKNTGGMAAKIFALLYKRLADKSRLFQGAVEAYAASVSFADSAWKVKNVLSVFQTLKTDEVKDVLGAYRGNPQNNESFMGRNQLRSLLEEWTGREWALQGNELKPVRKKP